MTISPKIAEMDTDRLESERSAYYQALDEGIEEAYSIASVAKKKGLDFSSLLRYPEHRI